MATTLYAVDAQRLLAKTRVNLSNLTDLRNSYGYCLPSCHRDKLNDVISSLICEVDQLKEDIRLNKIL